MDDVGLAVEWTPAELFACSHLLDDDALAVLLQRPLQDLLVHLAGTRWLGAGHVLGDLVGLVLLPQPLKLRLGQVLHLHLCREKVHCGHESLIIIREDALWSKVTD